jgi:uncharacterized protein YecT (DUF1311 family)
VTRRRVAIRLGLPLVTALAAQPSLAGTPLEDCYAKHANRVEVGQCLKAERVAAVDELRGTYAEAKAATGKAGAARDSEAPGKALERSQKAWIAYRDAQCRLAYEMMMPGTGAGDAANDCIIRLTRERNRTLQALVE